MVGTRLHRAPVGPWLPYGCPCPAWWRLSHGDRWVVPPETRYQRRVREMSGAEYAAELDRRSQLARAVEEMRGRIQVGDRVQRTRCGGGVGTFTFTHWEGDWMCGKTVYDCHPVNVRKINGAPIVHPGAENGTS